MSDLPATGERLEAGLRSMGIPHSEAQRASLLEYLSLLLRWNSSYNLTAVRDPLAMVDRHLLDSLALLPFIRDIGCRLVDVGTGAGLPGVPLAIMQRENSMDLIDSNGKKTRFLFQKAGRPLKRMTTCSPAPLPRCLTWCPVVPTCVTARPGCWP